MEPIIIGSTVSPSIRGYQSYGSGIWCQNLYGGRVLVEHMEMFNAHSDPIPGMQFLVSLTGGVFYSLGLGAIKRHQAIRNAPFSQLVLAGTGRALLVTAPTPNFSQEHWDLDQVATTQSFLNHSKTTMLFPPNEVNNSFTVRVVEMSGEAFAPLISLATTVVVTLRGQGNLLFDGQEYVLEEDSVVVVPPNILHALGTQGQARFLIIYVPYIATEQYSQFLK